MTKKQAAATRSAEDLVALVRKKFGKVAASVPGLDDPMSGVRGVIPCGVDVVDRYVMGIGGAARGRISEVFSEPGVAKTTYLWTQLGGCQRQGGTAVYCDLERSFDKFRPASFGLDLKSLALLEPYTLEEALEQTQAVAEALPDNGGPAIIALDSIAGGAYVGDMEGNYSDNPRDTRAARIGSWIRAMNALATRKQFHLLLLNQTRQKRGLIFGDKTTTPGGDGPKFFASLRMQLFGGKALKNAQGLHVGKTVTFFLVKSRFSPPFRKAKVRLDYEKGWDNVWSTINHAKDMKLIQDGSKVSADTYQKAVAALGWADASPAVETQAGAIEGEDVDDAEVADFAGEPIAADE